MAARVSQTGVLAVDQGAPKVRTSQTGILAVDQGAPAARVSQTGILAVVVYATESPWWIYCQSMMGSLGSGDGVAHV